MKQSLPSLAGARRQRGGGSARPWLGYALTHRLGDWANLRESLDLHKDGKQECLPYFVGQTFLFATTQGKQECLPHNYLPVSVTSASS